MTTAEFLASLESSAIVGLDDRNYSDSFFNHSATQDKEEADEVVAYE